MNLIKKGMMALAACAIFISLTLSAAAQSKNKANTMKKKILFVVTSHDKKGSSGEPTGYYLGEVTHAWKVLKDAGYEIDFVSPKGGQPPVDGLDLSDAVNKEFWDDQYYHNKINHSLKPAEVKPDEYSTIYYAGGHGAVWDFPDNEEISAIATKIYENNGIVSAVCHGPAGIVNIKLSDGKYLIAGKKVNGFTNEEEVAVKLDKVVPFLLEDKLIERGGIYEKSAPWQEHVVTDQRLVTGQNPQSAHAVGKAVLALLSK
jgi:putative intracellular protease/amidase